MDTDRETSESNQTVKELQEQREWLRVTLSSIGDAVITTDAKGCVTFLNPVTTSRTEIDGCCAAASTLVANSSNVEITTRLNYFAEEAFSPKNLGFQLANTWPKITAQGVYIMVRNGKER